MKTLSKHKSIWLTVFAVTITVILIKLIVSIPIRYYIFNMHINIARSFPPEETAEVTKHPSQIEITLLWTSTIISWMLLLIAGFFVGWKAKTSGWLYGGMIGVFLSSISFIFLMGILMLYMFFPTYVFGQKFMSMSGSRSIQNDHVKQIEKALLVTFLNVSIPLTALGGFLGEYMHTKRKKKK